MIFILGYFKEMLTTSARF